MINYKDHEYIRKKCKRYRIENYTINQDASIDVDGDVKLIELNLAKLPAQNQYQKQNQ